MQTIAILAHEPIQVITRSGSKLRSLTDLDGKRVGMGSPESGTRFTADRLMTSIGLTVRADSSSFDGAFKRLETRRVDAAIYVGSVGASERLRQRLVSNPNLRLLPMPREVINYLTTRDPGSYQAATILMGAYEARPAIPAQDIPTLSTATVLVTRPDVDDKQVRLLTWAILSKSRKFSPFYPDLQTGDPRSLLQKGLFYIHPSAQAVYEHGDPRSAWIRY